MMSSFQQQYEIPEEDMSKKYFNLSNTKGKKLQMWSRLLRVTPSQLLQMPAEDVKHRMDIVNKEVQNWMENNEMKAVSENASKKYFSIEGYDDSAEEVDKICQALTDSTDKNAEDLIEARFEDLLCWQTDAERVFSDPDRKRGGEDAASKTGKGRQQQTAYLYENSLAAACAPNKVFQIPVNAKLIGLAELKTPILMSPSNSDVQLFESLSTSSVCPIRFRAGENDEDMNYEDFSRNLRENEAAHGTAFDTQNNLFLGGTNTSSYRVPGQKSLDLREFMGPSARRPNTSDSRSFHSVPMRNFDGSGRADHQLPSRSRNPRVTPNAGNAASFHSIPYVAGNQPPQSAGSAAYNQRQQPAPRQLPEGYSPNASSSPDEGYGNDYLPPDYDNNQISYPIQDPPDYRRRKWPSAKDPYSSSMPRQPSRDTRIQDMSDFTRQLADFKRQLQALQRQSQGWTSRPGTPYVATMGAVGLPHIEAHLQIYFLGANQTIGYDHY